MHVSQLPARLAYLRLGYSRYDIRGHEQEEDTPEPRPFMELRRNTFYHMSCIFSGERGVTIHATGINTYDNPYRYDHAECNAIKKLICNPSPRHKKINLMVIRTTRRRDLANSKPCGDCIRNMRVLAAQRGYKIEYVFYSTKSGDITRVKLSSLENEEDQHISNMFRARARCNGGAHLYHGSKQ